MTLQQVSPAQTRLHAPHSAEVFMPGDMYIMAPASDSTVLPLFTLIVSTWQSEPGDINTKMVQWIAIVAQNQSSTHETSSINSIDRAQVSQIAKAYTYRKSIMTNR
jgi:hypothetical protein